MHSESRLSHTWEITCSIISTIFWITLLAALIAHSWVMLSMRGSADIHIEIELPAIIDASFATRGCIATVQPATLHAGVVKARTCTGHESPVLTAFFITVLVGFAILGLILGFLVLTGDFVPVEALDARRPAPERVRSFTLGDLDQLLASIGTISVHTREHVRRLTAAIIRDDPLTADIVDLVLSQIPEITPEVRAQLHLLIKAHGRESQTP